MYNNLSDGNYCTGSNGANYFCEPGDGLSIKLLLRRTLVLLVLSGGRSLNTNSLHTSFLNCNAITRCRAKTDGVINNYFF